MFDGFSKTSSSFSFAPSKIHKETPTQAAQRVFESNSALIKNDTGVTHEGLKAIALSEGYVDNVYICKHKAPTVGFGQNLNSKFNRDILTKEGVSIEELRKGDIVLKEKQATKAFYQAVKEIKGDCRKVFKGFNTLDSNVQDVLVNVMYQQGMPSFKKMDGLVTVVNEAIAGKATNKQIFDELNKTSFAKSHKHRMEHMKSLMNK